MPKPDTNPPCKGFGGIWGDFFKKIGLKVKFLKGKVVACAESLYRAEFFCRYVAATIPPQKHPILTSFSLKKWKTRRYDQKRFMSKKRKMDPFLDVKMSTKHSKFISLYSTDNLFVK